MFIYTFFGKVLPERAHVTLGPIPRMGFERFSQMGSWTLMLKL